MRMGRRIGFELLMGGRAFVFRFLGQLVEFPLIFAADIPRYTLRLALDGGKVAGLAFLLGAWRASADGWVDGIAGHACTRPAFAIYFADAGGIQPGRWANRWHNWDGVLWGKE